MLTEIFKIIQIVIIVVFAVFISDFRRKKGMKPLINEKLTRILKLSYLVPLTIYIYVIITLESIALYDYLALAITTAGALTAAKGKMDLSPCHTWTGYCLDSSQLMVNGIYAYIRHPIYTGIYIFTIGGLLTVIPHATLILSSIIVAAVVFILSFLAIITHKENVYLSEKIGPEYLEYKNQVNSFLPIRKYKGS
jgi:protein-S-isoprenylcysteine O-methyltransferase Ste14